MEKLVLTGTVYQWREKENFFLECGPTTFVWFMAIRGHGGGKGTVTPLLKGKVRIPPPARHFIDPPLLAPRIFFQDLGKNPQK